MYLDRFVPTAPQRQIYYTGQFPVAGTTPLCKEQRIDGLKNPNLFGIAIVKSGKSPEECAQTTGAVPLGVSQKTTSGDMMGIFGALNPKAPVTITACTTGPDDIRLRVDITYTNSP